MAAEFGSDLPGQPPSHCVDDDVALLQIGDDDLTEPPEDPGKVQSPSSLHSPAVHHNEPQHQPQQRGYANPTGYSSQAFPSMPTNNHYIDHRQPQLPLTVVREVNSAHVPEESFCSMIAFACFVFWCCNIAFGTAALILAVQAEGVKFESRESARKLGRKSMWYSIFGVVCGIVVIPIFLVLLLNKSR